jgi:hypothetical protein
MKRRESKEPDLYVVNKKPTEKELKELSEFIKEYKRKQELKKKHKRAA